VTRIIEALEAGNGSSSSATTISTDDGAAMLYLFLKEAGARRRVLHPDRIKEGYGFPSGDRPGRRTASESSSPWTAGLRRWSRSNMRGTWPGRHHLRSPRDRIRPPPGYAVLDPITPNDPYPFKSLCGCGVGFKLLQGLAGVSAAKKTSSSISIL